MGQIGYILKIVIATCIVVVLMQVKVGENTIENHAEKFIRTSSTTAIFRDVAQGGFLVAKTTYHGIAKTVDSFFTKNFRAEESPGRRKLVEVKRSLGFHKEQEKKLQEREQEIEASEEIY